MSTITSPPTQPPPTNRAEPHLIIYIYMYKRPYIHPPTIYLIRLLTARFIRSKRKA